MNRYVRGPQFVALALMGLVLTEVRGQEPQPSRTVAGQGMVELKRQAEFLRVEVDVLAKGKDIKECWQNYATAARRPRSVWKG